MRYIKYYDYLYITVHALAFFFITSCKDYDEHSFIWNVDGEPVHTWQTTIRSDIVKGTLTGCGWKFYEAYIINADGTYGDSLYHDGSSLPLAYFFFSPDSVTVFTNVGNDTICKKQRYCYQQEYNKLLISNESIMTLTHLNKYEWRAIEAVDSLFGHAVFVTSIYTLMSQDALDSLMQLSSSVNLIDYE